MLRRKGDLGLCLGKSKDTIYGYESLQTADQELKRQNGGRSYARNKYSPVSFLYLGTYM